MLNAILVGLAAIVSLVLLSKKVRDNRAWRATVTPLASIIGSGFLVIVPLLGTSVAGYAPIAIAAIVLLAYLIGGAIRFNIRYAETLQSDTELDSSTRSLVVRFEFLSDAALAIAYFISVTFYIRLLASFALGAVGVESVIQANLITTVVLAAIGLVGWFRGLSWLERLEEYSVSIKLAIIVALIVGWSVHDISTMESFTLARLPPVTDGPWNLLRTLAGVLIVVQGFETSRYIGDEYDATTRIRTMRWAQIVAGVIYVVFVALTVPTLHLLSDEVEETAIIDLSKAVASSLPWMLIIAAMMSQFSAAIADTIGAGGLFENTIGKHLGLGAKVGYLVVAGIGIALVWLADIFEIISLASRAFAIYYAAQSLLAAVIAYRGVGLGEAQSHPRRGLATGFALLGALLVGVSIIAIPAG